MGTLQLYRTSRQARNSESGKNVYIRTAGIFVSFVNIIPKRRSRSSSEEPIPWAYVSSPVCSALRGKYSIVRTDVTRCRPSSLGQSLYSVVLATEGSTQPHVKQSMVARTAMRRGDVVVWRACSKAGGAGTNYATIKVSRAARTHMSKLR